MKKVIAGGLLIAVAVVAWLLWSHHSSSSATSSAANGSGSAITRAERARAAVPASLSGRVTNKANGAGIANAVVALSSGGAFGGELGIGTSMVTAITDATGAWTAGSVAPGDYIITAAAPGFLPAQTPKLSIGSAEQRKDIALALAPGGTIVKGTVTDIGGGPIEGARIALRSEDRFDWNTADFVVLTNHDGTYQVSLADGNYSISAKHDDYVPKSQSIAVAGKPVTSDFVLTPGAGVRGVVVARDTGKPLAFALVHAVPARARFEGGGGEPVTADADGKFVVHSLRSGVIAISAFGRGYASVAPTTVEVGIGEQVDNIRVVVDRAYTISGVVVKKGTKTGIAGIHLGAFSMAQGSQANAVDPSDTQGRFAIDGVRPGSFMLYAMGEHEVPNIGKQVQIVDKDISDVVLEIEAGVTVTGHVSPPQEATVGVELAGAVGIANLFEAVKTMMVHADTDPTTGEFKLTNVPSGAFKLVAKSKAGPVGTLPVVIADADMKDLVVAMEARAAVSGKVVDTSGVPIADARITTRRTDDSKDNSDTNIQINGGPAPHKSLQDGTFRIVGLEAGTYELDAMVNDEFFDFGDKKKKKVSVTLTASEDKTGVTLVVEAHNGVIRGQVVGSDKQPAPDSWVTAKRISRPKTDGDNQNEDWWPSSEPVLTGADGKFTITKLRDGDYNVVAEGPHGGSRAEKAPVKPGDNVTIELAPLGTLTGHVTSVGAPVTVYSITCHGPSTAERTIAAADGAYSIEHMAPGKYACSVSCDAGTANGAVEIPPGPATLDLKLTAWASVTGTVINMFDRKPVVGLLALAGMEDNDAGMADVIAGNGPKTDATGRFVVPKVPVGTGSLMIMDGTGGFKPLATKPYTVTDGQRVDVGTIEIVAPRQGDAGTLGMVCEPTETEGSAQPKSLTVMQVKPDGPAAAAGIAVGDVITSIDGRNVSDLGVVQSLNYLSSGTIGIGVTVAIGLDKKGTINVTSVKW
jgi:protocatechuate 3,4-dioxygenase beta subunit